MLRLRLVFLKALLVACGAVACREPPLTSRTPPDTITPADSGEADGGALGDGGTAGGDGSLSVTVVNVEPTPGAGSYDVRVVPAGAGCVAAAVAAVQLGGVRPDGGEGLSAEFELPPGRYDVCLRTLADGGGPCDATARAVPVWPSARTDVMIILACGGSPADEGRPSINSISTEGGDRISVCETAKVTVSASTPGGDGLTYVWNVVSGPSQGVLMADRATALFNATAPGDYRLKVTVSNPRGKEASLEFVIHVVEASLATDRANCGGCGNVCQPHSECVDRVCSCAAGYGLVSTGACKPILFSDDFSDGALSSSWLPMRKAFVESAGHLAVGDLPRPGFNYGHSGNGRDALVATHAGDRKWTDYRLDVDARSLPPGSYNPYGVTSCERFLRIGFRVEQTAESWNAPAFTGYGLTIVPSVAGCGPVANPVGGGWERNAYFPGTGCCVENPAYESSGLPAVVAPAVVDDVNHYGLEVVGPTVKLWVNGQLVYDVVDPAAADGGLRPPQFGGIQFMWLWESLGWIDNVVVTDMR